ncbi:VOC family protein [Pyruvatibacter sp.]|uniref:VOC family protein n=1 Tax=Pyruvatibacter sp. TaxID=1981328 RepID=UPI0032EC5CC3
MNDLKITGYRIFVPDVATALPFYRDLLSLPVRAVADDGGFAVLDAGIMLILEPVGDDPNLTRRFTGVSFEVADITAAYQELRGKGVEFADGPHMQEWGGKLAHFMDPGGNTLTIVEYPTR